MSANAPALPQHLVPGDIVVVTGAAQGIGRATAQRLAGLGGRIEVWDVNQEGGAETVELCRSAGGEAHFSRVDVGDRASIETACANLCRDRGIPYALVNNAAIYPRSRIEDLEFDEWESVLRVNLTGAFVCARLLAPRMAGNRRGAIVNISSTIGLKGDPVGAHYSASKAGLLSLTKSLALAFGADGIRANCVMPGLADTAQPLGTMTRSELLARGKDIPLGRVGQPGDVAGVVAFLIGADAAYITGQSIVVNGGALMVP
jgi:3-oxoacyl-[acyl-carrier protein] reductase